MFTLKLENENGEVLTLTQAQDRYQVLDIQGLNPPNATIYQSEVSGMDGTKEMSKKLGTRNLVILVRINGAVERNRLKLYNFAKTKHYCKVWYKNGSRDVYIEGTVETNECPLFTNSEQMQISIICSDPYFQSVEEIVTDVSQVLGNFEFPFAFGADGVEEGTTTDEAIEFSVYIENRIVNVVNEGEDDTGLIIRITATGRVVNPTIYNVATREAFSLKITMEKSDVLTINTGRGRKSVKLLHGTTLSNCINKVVRESTWLNLAKGDNLFTYDADEETASSMNVVFTHRTKYQAV